MEGWVKNAGAQGGRRKEAATRIREWTYNQQSDNDKFLPLDLSGLNLDELPVYLPVELRHLNIQNNRLAKLPQLDSLPVKLMSLDVCGNPVAELPAESTAAGPKRLMIKIDSGLITEDVKSKYLQATSGPIYRFSNA